MLCYPLEWFVTAVRGEANGSRDVSDLHRRTIGIVRREVRESPKSGWNEQRGASLLNDAPPQRSLGRLENGEGSWNNPYDLIDNGQKKLIAELCLRKI